MMISYAVPPATMWHAERGTGELRGVKDRVQALPARLKAEGSQLTTDCSQLKMHPSHVH